MKRTIKDITKICQDYLNQNDLKLIQKAYNFANKAHKGQKRKNGDDFIQHPIHTALTLAQMRLDKETISASLLHDTIEDANTEIDKIKDEFGGEITNLVSGVTRIGIVKLKTDVPNKKLDDREKSQIENLRKMFVAMAKDLRVILIKLADRLHNMQTLYALPKEKAQRIARETMEIYAPLAHRLGIGEIKGELEDLAFPYLYPNDYKYVKSLFGEKSIQKKKIIEKIIEILKKEIQKEKIKIIDIHGRSKHLYSLYKKLLKYDKDISKIYDLMAVRVIVDDIATCYKVLGIIHKIWKPLPGYIKDYIAMPKPNGYQSLHTTVFSIDGNICEIQIRTKKMHEHGEYGIAAHWYYANKIGLKDEIEQKGIFAPTKETAWISELAKRQEKLKDPSDFKKALKLDFFSDRIFAWTPQGDVKNLPLGASPIDFAYAIHSEVGDHCLGARINGKMKSLNYQLENCDIVEIITSKNSKPRQDWLRLAKTAEARSKIRRYLRNKNLI